MTLELPDLPYSHDALAPTMSAETLEFHHDKHHLAYVDNTNRLLADSPLAGKSLEQIVVESHQANEALFNNAAQHLNHLHFWNWMVPNGGGSKLPETISKLFDRDLGGYEKFRADFIQAGVSQFGSGWAWVVCDGGALKISKTPNGVNPIVFGQTPILGVDVWEHSYYIDHRNARPAYLSAFVDHLVNWDYVEALLRAALDQQAS